MSEKILPADLEDRFSEPKGWRWHSFMREGRHIRFGSAFPQNSIPDAVIVCLQGVREFSEKYYEVANWCNYNNFAFWTFDWAGQGESTRYLKNPQKRHSDGFDNDIKDLHYLIMEYIKHSSVHPDRGRIPMALLGHSMGANIGMRFLEQYPDIFECAAFTSPMFGIKKFTNTPNIISSLATLTCKIFASHHYIPDGNNWVNDIPPAHETLSNDTARIMVNKSWCELNPSLQCGDVTFGWLYEAHKSCKIVQTPSLQKNIKTPCLFAIPGHEHLVDNKIARKVISNINNSKTIELPTSHHEILMETDDIRGRFLDEFYNLLKENIIDCPETLKPF